MSPGDPTIGDTVLPGDQFFVTVSGKGKIILGPGLNLQKDEETEEKKRAVFCTKCGILRFRAPNVFWVDTHQKRYVPAIGDHAMGLIISKIGVDMFRTDIGAPQPAALSYLHFEGATKKNRPNVKVGDVVYCKIIVDDKEREPEVSCVDTYGKAAGMGLLDGGMMIQLSLNCVRKITSKQCVLMKFLGKHIPFEVACGMNGRVWVKTASIKSTITVCNAIQNSEFMTNEQIKLMIISFVDCSKEEFLTEGNNVEMTDETE